MFSISFSTYTGGVVNGIRNGNGTCYSGNSNSVPFYSGSWIDGKRNGKVSVLCRVCARMCVQTDTAQSKGIQYT